MTSKNRKNKKTEADRYLEEQLCPSEAKADSGKNSHGPIAPRPSLKADRYLEERLHENEAKTVPSEEMPSASTPPPLPPPGHPQRSFPEDVPSIPHSEMPGDMGVGWLDFVNYILLPINCVSLVIFAFYLVSEEALLPAIDSGFFLLHALDFVMIVALIFGLRKRRSWAWWLMMLLLVLKAPLGALMRFDPARQEEAFWGFMFGGFLIVCLPQLIYFYKRRGLFNVQFENDR